MEFHRPSESPSSSFPALDLLISSHVEKLQRDGITALRGAFARKWVDRMRDDMMTAFWEAIQRPGGTIGRGRRRWYAEIHPQAFSGFIELATHPWIHAMSEAVLGADYQIVEIGFDVPFEGAKDQPWHRDFPSPRETYEKRRLTSIAFNLTGVDVTQDMGPFEVALGTQWEDGRAWESEMFPPPTFWPRYEDRAARTFPKMGDISCRSALTIHRGTAHASMIPRPVLVLGVDAPGAGHAALHDLTVTQDYYKALPDLLKQHLVCRVVEKLEPISQKHGIAGLSMASETST